MLKRFVLVPSTSVFYTILVGLSRREMSMRIKVDFDLCKGHANCMGEAPEVFEVDDKGFLNILQEEPAEALRERVELAVKHCPTGAISLED